MSLIVVVISQCICVSNYQVVDLKYRPFLFVNPTSVEQEESHFKKAKIKKKKKLSGIKKLHRSFLMMNFCYKSLIPAFLFLTRWANYLFWVIIILISFILPPQHLVIRILCKCL